MLAVAQAAFPARRGCSAVPCEHLAYVLDEAALECDVRRAGRPATLSGRGKEPWRRLCGCSRSNSTSCLVSLTA